jgi:hypothetical protein
MPPSNAFRLLPVWMLGAFVVAAAIAYAGFSRSTDRQTASTPQPLVADDAPLQSHPPPEGVVADEAPPRSDPPPDVVAEVPAAAPTPATPVSILATHQVVAYYGNPYSPVMGILGEYSIPDLIRRLQAQSERYQALNAEQTVLPALHFIYAVAQEGPGREGSFLYHMPDDLVERYIEQTAAHGMLLFIDLQMGRADPVAEVERVRHWLSYEHVHLAVDPEFTMAPGQRPGINIGSIDAGTINRIQAVLHDIAFTSSISNKILIVHQFLADMITGKTGISNDELVDLVIDLDGFGPPFGKLEKYTALATNEPLEYTGFKLFYRWDEPMMTEAEVQSLVPRPSVVIYQ